MAFADSIHNIHVLWLDRLDSRHCVCNCALAPGLSHPVQDTEISAAGVDVTTEYKPMVNSSTSLFSIRGRNDDEPRKKNFFFPFSYTLLPQVRTTQWRTQ